MDRVLQGYGTTNTCSFARRCFRNPDLFAKALEINVKLFNNISTILWAYKCKQLLKLGKLEACCWETYCLNYQLYPSARMNSTLHKLLKHSCVI